MTHFVTWSVALCVAFCTKVTPDTLSVTVDTLVSHARLHAGSHIPGRCPSSTLSHMVGTNKVLLSRTKQRYTPTSPSYGPHHPSLIPPHAQRRPFACADAASPHLPLTLACEAVHVSEHVCGNVHEGGPTQAALLRGLRVLRNGACRRTCTRHVCTQDPVHMRVSVCW